MDNDLTMPLHSHCIQEIELHNLELGCTPSAYCIVSNVEYALVVGYSATSNTISFDYDYITVDSSCDETHNLGSDTIDVTFSENENNGDRAQIGFVYYMYGTPAETTIPYYFTQLGRHFDSLVYVSTAQTFVNTSAFTNPSLVSHTYSGEQGTIKFSDMLTEIPDYAFYRETHEASQYWRDFSNFSSISLPLSVTRIGTRAFSYNPNLLSINIPSGVTSIGDYAFYYCIQLNNVIIPSNVTNIGVMAFGECNALTSINIPSGVTSISNRAFYYCTSLTSINIPSGVTNFGYGAFSNCSRLTSITVNAIVPPTLGNGVFEATNGCPIYVPAESVESYKSASGWSEYASRIQAIP